MTNTSISEFKLNPLHGVLLKAAEAVLNNRSQSVNTDGDDNQVNLDANELNPVVRLLTGGSLREVTELNLTLASLGSNWKERPREETIADYLTDFLSYVIPRIENLDDWKEGFDEQYRRFEDEYVSDQLTVEFFGHLGNFSYRFSDTGELNDHTKLVILPSQGVETRHDEYACNNFADSLRVRRALNSCFPALNEESWRHSEFLNHRIAFPKKELKPRFNAYELMRKFVFGVRILSPSGAKPFCDFVVAFYQGRLSGSMPLQTSAFPEDQIDKSGWVDFEWNSWLKKLWGKLETLSYLERLASLDHHIDDSLRRGHRSARNPYSKRLQIIDELERLSDYFSAFDSIYKTELRNGKTSEQIATVTARLMTHQWGNRILRSSNEYDKIHDEIMLMYKTRNHYEHGRLPNALNEAGKPEDFKERVRMLGWYLREVAIIYIMNDSLDLDRISDGDCSGLRNIY